MNKNFRPGLLILLFIWELVSPDRAWAWTQGLGGWFESAYQAGGVTYTNFVLDWTPGTYANIKTGDGVWWKRFAWHCDTAGLSYCDSSNGGTMFINGYIFMGQNPLPGSYTTYSTTYGAAYTCGTFQEDITATTQDYTDISGVVAGWVYSTGVNCSGPPPTPTPAPPTPTPCPPKVKVPTVTPYSPDAGATFPSTTTLVQLKADFVYRTVNGTRIREVWVWDKTQYLSAKYVRLCLKTNDPEDDVYGCNLRDTSDPKINLEPGHNYRWYSTAANECYSGESARRNFSLEAPTPTPTPTPTPATVSGKVYLDQMDPKATGPDKCTAVDAEIEGQVEPGASSLVRVNPDNLTGDVVPGGPYSINNVSSTNDKVISLENIDPGYTCTCPDGCTYADADIVDLGQGKWHFFVANVPPRWWQAFGGDVHAQEGFSSSAPAGSSVMVDQTSLITSPHGVASRLLGNPFTFPEGGTLSVLPIWDLADVLASASWRYGYQAMYARAGRPTASPGDGTAPPSADAMYQLTGDYAISGAGWNGLIGWRVIFVDGKVTINDKIKLTPGAFLAIIASGNIAVNPAVGRNTPLAAFSDPDAQSQLQGVFLADGSFKGGTDGLGADKQLVIYGTVAANADLFSGGSVQTQRDLGPDNDKPAVAFIWNPNLVINAPEEIGDAITDWRTSAP